MSEQIRVWRVHKDAPAGVMVAEKSALLVGSRRNFVAAGRSGVVISGDGISLNTSSENIRKGGLFIEMNDIVKMIPTTLVTPMPAQVPFPPLAMASAITKDMPFFQAALDVTKV